MSEYKTLKEWFGQATRGDGRKFTRSDWLENQWLEPIYLDKHKDWHCLDYEGYSRAWGSVNYPFKEWHPPKKKVTKYLWYNNYSKVVYPYMAKCIVDLQEQLHCNGTYVHKGDGNYTRLDWSATEFDDE